MPRKKKNDEEKISKSKRGRPSKKNQIKDVKSYKKTVKLNPNKIVTGKKITKTNLKSMKKAELVELALNMSLARISGLKKDEIIERILEAQKSEDVSKTTEPKKVLLTEDEGQIYTSSKKYELENIDFVVEPSYPIETRELPKDYNDNILSLLIRDPYWAYAYWEITDEKRKELDIPKGKHNKTMKIRLYEIYNGEKGEFYDIHIHDYTNNWYISLPKPNKNYIAELIIEDDQGKEISVLESNKAVSPRDNISDDIDVEWMTPDWAKIYSASAGFREKHLSEEELEEKFKEGPSSINLLQQPGSEQLMENFIGASENLLSSFPSSESAIKVVSAKGKEFWLKADCELILYGATEADAEVRVTGEIVKLNPDGSFTLRFALPEGEHKIDVKGINKDRDLEKSIIFHINKKTNI
jgi:hypothetical protein